MATNDNTYAGNTLDIYLNETWYNTLTADAKAAIVDKNLIQYQYFYDGYIYDKNTYASSADYSTKSVKNEAGNRHIYAIGIEDIEEYFNNEFSTSDIQEMFNTIEEYIWLNSAQANSSSDAWCVTRNYSLGDDEANYSNAARPAFQIDLSKVSWS